MSTPSPANLVAAGVVLSVVGAVVYGARFALRKKIQHQVKIDDWILVPSLLFLIGMGAVLITGVALRVLGFPNPKLSDDPMVNFENPTYNVVVVSQLEWAMALLQPPQITCVKLSFLFFYRRVFVIPGKASLFSKLTWLGIVVTAAWGLSWLLTEFLSCVATSGQFWPYWGSEVDLTTKCIKTEIESEFFAASDVLVDLYVLFLPIPKIWSLHMNIRRKIGVTAVFTLGLVSIAASLARLIIFTIYVRIGFRPEDDEVLIITTPMYWKMIESGLAFIAVSLPTLRVLLDTSTANHWLSSVRSGISLHSICSGK